MQHYDNVGTKAVPFVCMKAEYPTHDWLAHLLQ